MGYPFCRWISGTVDCFGCSPTPAGTARPQPGSRGMHWWSAMPPVHPPAARAAPQPQNPRIPEREGPQRPSNSTPFTRPSCQIILVWPWGWKSHPALPCASHQKPSNLSSTWPVLVPEHAEKGSEAAFSQTCFFPQA